MNANRSEGEEKFAESRMPASMAFHWFNISREPLPESGEFEGYEWLTGICVFNLERLCFSLPE